MRMNNFLKNIVVFSIFAILSTNLGFASNEVENTPSVKREYGRVQYKTKEFKTCLNQVDEKFNNLNINSAYEELNKLIFDYENNDYYLMILADKATNLGFFDLANIAFSKISDVEISEFNANNTKNLFFPKVVMDKEDIVFLAEAYSNIQHNDRKNEAIADVNSRFINKNNDYADYILALGHLELNDIENAQKHIQSALSKNPNNLNYKILQSRIVASQKKKNKKALKIVKNIKSENVSYYPIKKQIDANEQYVM